MTIHIAAVKVLPGRERVLVKGCAIRPHAEMAYADVRPYLPEGAETDDLNRYVAVDEPLIDGLQNQVARAAR